MSIPMHNVFCHLMKVGLYESVISIDHCELKVLDDDDFSLEKSETKKTNVRCSMFGTKYLVLHFSSLWQKICSFSSESSAACFIKRRIIKSVLNCPEKFVVGTRKAWVSSSKRIGLTGGSRSASCPLPISWYSFVFEAMSNRNASISWINKCFSVRFSSSYHIVRHDIHYRFHLSEDQFVLLFLPRHMYLHMCWHEYYRQYAYDPIELLILLDYYLKMRKKNSIKVFRSISSDRWSLVCMI